MLIKTKSTSLILLLLWCNIGIWYTACEIDEGMMQRTKCISTIFIPVFPGQKGVGVG